MVVGKIFPLEGINFKSLCYDIDEPAKLGNQSSEYHSEPL